MHAPNQDPNHETGHELPMNPIMRAELESLELAAPVARGPLTIIPILGDEDKGPDYITLGEALRDNLIEISEIDKGGSVPELAVDCRSARPVLLLDGEELIGAKQNRVLNATVLLPPECRTVVPVSCVEAGRWAYKSASFADSETVMHSMGRRNKQVEVQKSLRSKRGYVGDQGRVWEDVRHLSEACEVSSPTSAMADVYRERRDEIQAYLSAIPHIDRQRGLVALIGDRVIGMDLISRPSAYTRLHERLLRSYAMEAISSRGKVKPAAEPEAALKTFITAALECRETRHSPVGWGTDHRFLGKGVCGSALIHEETVIHAALFSAEEEDIHDDEPRLRMSSYRSRRRRHHDDVE